MTLFYRLTVMISLLVLVGVAIGIYCEIRRFNNTIDSIRGEIPMSGLEN